MKHEDERDLSDESEVIPIVSNIMDSLVQMPVGGVAYNPIASVEMATEA